MNYIKIYTKIIERARTRELETYTESHHILPASLFNGKRKSKMANRAENLVDLTPKEHYIAHLCLMHMFPDDETMRAACKMVLVYKSGKRYDRIRGWINKRWHDARPKIECRVCSKVFTVGPSDKDRKYCSYECSAIGRRTGYNTPCKNCGYDVYQIASTKGRGYKFCSIDCSKTYHTITRECQHCKKEFTTKRAYKNRKFCSRVCDNASRKFLVTKYKTCECCGKEFDPKYNKTARFCSQSCSSRSRRRNKLINTSK